MLATYADQFYAGKAAAVTRSWAKAPSLTSASIRWTGDLEAALLRKVWTAAGAAPAALKPDFLVDWRDGFWVATNFTSAAQTIPARAGAEMLVGARMVPPGGVSVWME